MSHIDHKALAHLKKLCRIDCSEKEESELLEGLDRALEYIKQLNEVDTIQVNPCSYVLRTMLKNKMREDFVADTLSKEQFLANAPDQIGGMIRTPPILKKIP